jgi:glycosyltransferase involved in cell wall biosynthesis
MAQVVRALLASPLAEKYQMRMIVTYAVLSAPRKAVRFACGLTELFVWCLGSGARIVHVQSAVRGSLYRKAACVFVARLLRRPVLFHVHAGPGDIEDFAATLGPIRRATITAALRRTRTIAVSSESARALERCFGLDSVGVLLNPAPAAIDGGVDVGAPGGNQVLYIGGFADPAKGGDVLVEALGTLVDDYPEDRFELYGPGRPPAGLHELSARSANVDWGGWLDAGAKVEAFREASIFVLPSISEGLPVALLEAMAWGRAIIATSMGGVLDLINDEEDGLWVQPGSSTDLARVLRRLLDDGELRRRLAISARRRVGDFEEGAIWRQLDSIYEEMAT